MIPMSDIEYDQWRQQTELLHTIKYQLAWIIALMFIIGIPAVAYFVVFLAQIAG